MSRWLQVLIFGLFSLVVAGCGGDNVTLEETEETKALEEEATQSMEQEMMKQGKGSSKGK